MSFEERSKKFKQKKTKSTNTPVVQNVIFGIDNVLMDLFCSYVLSENSLIHNYSMINLNRLMNYITEENFNKNQILIIKYRYLLLALQARLAGLTRELIKSDISRKMNIEGLYDDPRFGKELSNEEVQYAENTIGQFLNTVVFDSKINNLMNLCQGYQKGNYIERQNYLADIRGVMQDTIAQFRKNDASETTSSTRFRLSEMENSIKDIHAYITNPSFKLITGMQGMNGLLGGGFQKTKVYCYFGMSGEGKTTTITNVFYQVWKYNKGFKTKDPTKKPCIILFTMENLVIEYVCTLFHIVTGGKNIKDCSSADAALEEFRERKFEYQGPEDIEIVIDFKAAGTKDTSYCYQLVDEMEDEGYETIFFAMDYLMRIKPMNYSPGDLYNNLGEVVNEFKVFAMTKDVPFLTASQLNRTAAMILDEGRSKNQNDIIRRLGRGMIGDSVQIDRNLDGLIILVPEVDQDGRRYLAYRLIKRRYDVFVPYNIIYQPYLNNSPVALVEDLLLKEPEFKLTLGPDQQTLKDNFTNAIRVNPSEKLQNKEKILDLMDSSKEKAKDMISQSNNVDDAFDLSNLVAPSEKEINVDFTGLVVIKDEKPKTIDVETSTGTVISGKRQIVQISPVEVINEAPPKEKIEIVKIIPKESREKMYEMHFKGRKNPFKERYKNIDKYYM